MSNLLQHVVKQRCMEDWLLSQICHSWFFQLRMFLLFWALNLSAWKLYRKLRQMSEGVKSIYINSMAVHPRAEDLVCYASFKMRWNLSIWLQARLQTDLSPSTFANSSLLCVYGTTNSAFCPKNGPNHRRHGRWHCGQPRRAIPVPEGEEVLAGYFISILNFLAVQKTM